MQQPYCPTFCCIEIVLLSLSVFYTISMLFGSKLLTTFTKGYLIRFFIFGGYIECTHIISQLVLNYKSQALCITCSAQLIKQCLKTIEIVVQREPGCHQILRLYNITGVTGFHSIKKIFYIHLKQFRFWPSADVKPMPKDTVQAMPCKCM